MPKGYFSQTLVVLFKQHVGLSELRSLLTGFDVVKDVPASEHWEFAGPALVIAYMPGVNGLVAVDIVDRAWPDHMGAPKDAPTLFGAWSMGYFGPFTYPGSLERALQHSSPDATDAARRHKAFARIHVSYVFGADGNARLLPENYRPLPELAFITGLASALLQHPHALCYFNPNGELLLTKANLDKQIAFAATSAIRPLDVWMNFRLFNFDRPDGDPNWLMMDTVGNQQLDILDQEIFFPKKDVSPDEAYRWLRNATGYMLDNGEVIKDGDTMDGPGGRRQQAKHFSVGLISPPRRVLRWLPCGVADIPSVWLEEQQCPIQRSSA